MLTLQRVRMLIEEHQFPQLKQVTISIGFVEVAGQQTPSDVIGEADEALYFSKQNGRNQVHSYHQLIEQGKLEKHDAKHAEGDIELF